MWNEQYAIQRLEDCPKKRDYLRMMQCFTVFGEGLMAALREQVEMHDDPDSDAAIMEQNMAGAMHRVMSSFHDANRLSDLREAINCIGVTDPISIEALKKN